MTSWFENFASSTLGDVLRSQSENRAWNKDLRLRSAALVNSRLAKQIGQEEYTVNRKLVQEDALECKRRAMILMGEISSRGRA